MSITAGVDIGSTASKALILVDGTVAGYVVGPSSTNPARTAREIYRQALEKTGRSASEVSYIVGTGYGRTRVEVVMTGGVAKNRGVRDALEKKLGIVLNGFDGMDPQIVGALGAALIAADLASGTRADP